MPLALPNLDDRRWGEMVEEAHALIPVYTPVWTDHNVSDPGITLLELLAWVAEIDVYRLNRIPEQRRWKFLALAGIAPEPTRAARTVLHFWLLSGASPVAVPATVEVEGKDPFGRRTMFRTLDGLTVVPGELKAVQVQDGQGFHDLTSRSGAGNSLQLFGENPRPGAMLYLGFSEPLPVDTPVSLFFVFSGLREAEHTRNRLREEFRASREACFPPPATLVCADEAARQPEDHALPPHHSVRLAWEYAAGAKAWRPLRPAEGELVDDTRSLTLTGSVRLQVPEAQSAVAVGAVAQKLHYIRCRFASGSYESAPEAQFVAMNAVLAEQAVPMSTRLPLAQGAVVSGPMPAPGDLVRFHLELAQGEIQQIKFAAVDPAAPEFRCLDFTPNQGFGLEAEFLGVGNGAPKQHYKLREAPVLESEFGLYSLEGEHWRAWTLRRDFDASARNAAHFLLDPGEGIVTFGDGERGRVPPNGALLFAAASATRGEEGNLAAGLVRQLSVSSHNRAVWLDFAANQVKQIEVTNLLPAGGGAPAEALHQTAARALAELEKPRRAVTLADYEALAREVPGVAIARVLARANQHPAFPCYQAPGVITVIVLPHVPLDRPMPSAALRRAVAAYLGRRRVLGTRVEVVGPTYVELSVRARVRACAGKDKDALAARISDALTRFFHPLRGGPEGTGWPFGRDVYRSEVLQVIDETPGVDHVLSLELIPQGGTPQCGNLCLGPTSLVASGQHAIEVV